MVHLLLTEYKSTTMKKCILKNSQKPHFVVEKDSREC